VEARLFARNGTALLAVSLALAGTSCVFGIDGKPPDPNQLYFPTGLVVSPGRTALYVANSDFDLQYAGGTLQVFDARGLRRAVGPLADALHDRAGAAAACQAAGLSTNPDPYLNPGPCTSFSVGDFLEKTAFIGAFASSLLLVHDPNGPGARLFSPVRGDPSLTYFDVEDDRTPPSEPSFRLDCNVGTDGFCGADHRVGRSAARSLRGLQLPPDPLGTSASSDGLALVSAHQTQATTSLVVNPWNGQPYLSYFTNRLANGPMALATIPRPALLSGAEAAALAGGYAVNYRDAFLLSYRAAPQLDLVEYFPDSGSIPPRPFLVVARQFPLTVSASNVDSRGVAIVTTERTECETRCGGGADALACQADCAEHVPLKLYVANRSPASLLTGRVHTVLVREADPAGGPSRITAILHEITMHGSIPLDYGAAHVRIGKVVEEDGSFADRVFAVSFDSRSIAIVDPKLDTVEATVRTGRGPQELAVDYGTDDGEPYSLGYVAHFTDSYLGILHLDRRRPSTYGQIIASLGQPLPPAGSR
jgi:hypothetical protein